MIEVDALFHHFGGVRALESISFAVQPGEVAAVVGPDGSGKSTLLALIAGEFAPSAGSISLAGKRIDGKAPHAIARRGVARTFQSPKLFDDLTALENATIGSKRPAAERAKHAVDLLAQLGMRANPRSSGAQLHHTDRRCVELARALCSQPRVLLLDEPTGGLTFAHAEQLRGAIREYASGHGAAVLISYRDLASAGRACDRAIVLHAGRKIADGKPAELRGNPEVLDAYLGVEWRQ
jgi:ABC-type branched-subunit amino acid transport system ATPase component